MSTPPDQDASDEAGAKIAFLERLEQQLAAIEENWGDLRGERWDHDQLLALYTRLRELAKAAGEFNLESLGDNVFAAEVYLSSFVDATVEPTPLQIEEIDGLIRALRAAADDLLQRMAQPHPASNQVLYLLGTAGAHLDALTAELTQRGCEVQRFPDAQVLVKAMDARLPSAIIADTGLLHGIAPIAAELVRLHNQQAVKLPLVFVGTSNGMQPRVEAMRAGGTAYFVAPFDAAAVADQILRLAGPREREAYRVVVVEDDPTQAEFAASILRKAGMSVNTVTEPLRVMDVLENFRPDLILMDIYMPDVNGIELTSVIREHGDFVVTPIVFLSGEQNTDKQLDALTVGGDDFIAKPIRPKHLLTVVKHRISRARNMQRVTGSASKPTATKAAPGRQQFLDRVTEAMTAADAEPQGSGALYLLPDQIESIRHQQGPVAAETLLGELLDRVRATLTPDELAVRFDAEGIAVLARRIDSAALQAHTERLREAIAALPFDLDGHPVNVTASVGVSPLERISEGATGLAARAEHACRDAHAAGGNATRVGTAGPVETTEASAAPDPSGPVVAALRDALANNSFVLRYHPLLDLQSRGSENYELLLSLPMPGGDALGQRDLRDAGLAADLQTSVDRWLVGQALDRIKEFRGAGHQLNLFVQQSAATAADPQHAAWLAEQLRSRRMVGTGLVLDYRLTDLSQDLKGVGRNLSALRDLDIEACISRFPEKPAAFKVLRFLRAGYIEVTPRLLKADQATISSVVQQAHALRAKVIVANIDDARCVNLHWSTGADLLQGNFIQHPLEQMDYDFYQIVV